MFWVLLLALGLRLINLNQSLWLDEAFQFKAIANFNLTDMLTVYLPGDFNPPLSYLINFFVGKFFGYSEIVLRLPSVIFGVITVWLVYKLSHKIWPALLLATSGLHLYYSQEARMYSLAAMAVTASFYFLKEKKWLWYWAFSLIAIYSHYLTVFIFPAQILLVKKTELKSLLLSWLAIAIGYFPWLLIFFQQLSAGQSVSGSAWGKVVGGLTVKNLLLIPIKFLIGRISLDNNLVFAALLVLPVLATVWWLIQGIKRQRFLAVWLLVPLLLIILFSLKLPVLSYFRLLFILPPFYLLISSVAPKKWLIGFLLLNLITSAIYLFNPAFHREDWQSLAKNIAPNQPVVMIPTVNAPLKYYYSGTVLATDTVPQADFSYVSYAEPIFDPTLTFRRQVESSGYQEKTTQSFRGGLTLIQYIR